MTILLTGATGFIGSSLAQHLEQRGHSLTAALRRVSDTLSPAIQQFPVGDLLPDTNWAFVLNEVDTIIHLAARVHIMRDTAIDPLTEFRRTNTAATLNLARQAAQAGARRFIYLSSIKVNGENTTDKPFSTEVQNTPTDPYALSKFDAERGLREIAIHSDMDVVIIRPPLVYSAGVKGNFQSIMKWVYKGIPLPLGSIHNQRSLVALDNLIDLISLCVEHPAAANQTFLVSDNEDLSTTELLTRLGEALGKSAFLLPVPQALLTKGLQLLGKENLAQRLCGNLQVDISKTRELLGWSPSVSVDNALKATAQAWLSQHK